MDNTILNLQWIGRASKARNSEEQENIFNPMIPLDKVLSNKILDFNMP